MGRYTEEELEKIKLYLSSGDFTYSDIASLLGRSTAGIRALCSKKGWTGLAKRLDSKGNVSLYNILKKILPFTRIEKEYHIGERLRLDIYIPDYKIGWEVQGIQHYKSIQYFHKDEDAFDKQIARDRRKNQLCKKQGIILVNIEPSDITYDNIKNILNGILEEYSEDCLEESVRENRIDDKSSSNWKDIAKANRKKYMRGFYEKAREYRKEQYRKWKHSRNK